MPAPHTTNGPRAGSSGLTRLLQVERACADRIARAQLQAEGLVGEAAVEAERRGKALQGHLAEEMRAVTAQLEADRDQRIEAIRTRSATDAAHYRAVDDTRVRDLAATLVGELLGMETPP